MNKEFIQRRLLCSAIVIIGFSVVLSACTQTDNIPINQNNNTQITSIALSPLSGWQHQQFSGTTNYSIIEEQGRHAIRAHSQSAASMLIKRIPIDLNQTPYINWQWRVDRVKANTKERQRVGDDFTARLYIAIESKGLSIYPRALNYIWASEAKPNSHWTNPYSDNVVMFTLQSGNNKAGQWVSEKRNLKADLFALFGEEINKIEGIALMTDTDNTQTNATAYYRDILFSEQ